MPEGDVVLRTARRLHAALAGRRLTVSDLRWPSLATVDLTGREVLAVVARGKHLLIRVDAEPEGAATATGGLTLHSHLRMEGSWSVDRTRPAGGTASYGGSGGRGYGRPARRPGHARPEHGVRAVLANREWTVTGHRLGMMNLVATSAEDTLVGHLGPDILAEGFDVGAAAARLGSLPGRPIGEALLDQRIIAGIGTFFMAETCFLRGVNPWRPVGEVKDVPGLVTLACRLMTLSAEHAMQVTTGDARRGQEQYVHGRSGRPCRRCGTTVRVAGIGKAPADRVAFWCPACQPGPVPTDRGGRQRPLGASRPTR